MNDTISPKEAQPQIEIEKEDFTRTEDLLTLFFKKNLSATRQELKEELEKYGKSEHALNAALKRLITNEGTIVKITKKEEFEKYSVPKKHAKNTAYFLKEYKDDLDKYYDIIKRFDEEKNVTKRRRLLIEIEDFAPKKPTTIQVEKMAELLSKKKLKKLDIKNADYNEAIQLARLICEHITYNYVESENLSNLLLKFYSNNPIIDNKNNLKQNILYSLALLNAKEEIIKSLKKDLPTANMGELLLDYTGWEFYPIFREYDSKLMEYGLTLPDAEYKKLLQIRKKNNSIKQLWERTSEKREKGTYKQYADPDFDEPSNKKPEGSDTK